MPIEHPKSLLLRLAYWQTKRAYGKVITPLKVVYARMPKSLWMARAMTKFLATGLSLDSELKFLISTHVASLNDCAFCVDIGRAMAMRARVPEEKLGAVREYWTSPLFTDRERAALAYVEEVTRTRRATDETFERLRLHFSEQEIAEITWLNALENYYNLINLPLEIEADGLCALRPQRQPASATQAPVQ
jgi:AhpD family alkylhydroperoxidase